MLTNLKIVKSGDRLEVYKYKDRIHYGPANYKQSIQKLYRFSPIQEQKKELNKQSLYRASVVLKRLVYSNAGKWENKKGRKYPTLFLTLTFKENLCDVQKAAYEFKKFIQKLNYEITRDKKSFAKYIAVPEFQKRGAVHYHVIIFNLPFIEKVYDRLNVIWGLGYFTLKTVKNVKKAANYICKYLKKEITDERLSGGKKRYYPSRGLNKPITTYKEETNNFILQFLPEEAKVFGQVRYSEYCGYFNYAVYDLNKFPENNDALLEINRIMQGM